MIFSPYIIRSFIFLEKIYLWQEQTLTRKLLGEKFMIVLKETFLTSMSSFVRSFLNSSKELFLNSL